MSRPTHFRWPMIRPAVAVLVLAHLLAVVLLAVSPRLHHWVHPDADDDDHDCAVVLFLHGSGNLGPAPLATPPGVVLTTDFPVAMPPAIFVPSVFTVGGVFEHGPPPSFG